MFVCARVLRSEHGISTSFAVKVKTICHSHTVRVLKGSTIGDSISTMWAEHLLQLPSCHLVSCIGGSQLDIEFKVGPSSQRLPSLPVVCLPSLLSLSLSLHLFLVYFCPIPPSLVFSSCKPMPHMCTQLHALQSCTRIYTHACTHTSCVNYRRVRGQ